MKKLLITLTGIMTALIIFSTGAFAAVTWMNYTGTEQVEQSNNDIDEIMDILRNVHEGKLSAEEAVTQLQARVDELEGMNPSGLAKQNKELREQVANLEEQLGAGNEYVEHLEAELNKANAQAEEHMSKTQSAVEEARTYGGNE